jgi:hypothetical protein
MRRLYPYLAALGLFSAAVGCHDHVAGICDCDSCGYGCCSYGLCCPEGGPGGPIPPVPVVQQAPTAPAPEMLREPTKMKGPYGMR